MPVVFAPPPVPPPLRRDGDVVILGAGFSRAINRLMPTLDELGRRIATPFKKTPSFRLLSPAAQAALKADQMPGGSLEAWLSNLATPAPFLDAAERLHNAAIAQELVKLIVLEITGSESDALLKPMPPWLGRLVTLWDRFAATVITFNYDTLVEQAVNASQMPWILWPAEDGATEGITVPLLKMHGSTNWWWIPSDRVGTTVQRAPLAGRWDKPRLTGVIRGMEPYIVPPTASKTDFYDLSITRDAWMSARVAIQQARRLILMGYSAPVTDLTVAALLSNYANPDLTIVVVNTAPDDIVQRLHDLGLHNAAAVGGDDPIAQFTEEYEYRISATVAKSLLPLFDGLDIAQDDPVVARVAGSGHEPLLPITQVQAGDGVTTFIATKRQPGDNVTDMALKAGDARMAIEQAGEHSRRVLLDVPGQPKRAVLNIARRVLNRNWLAIEA